MAILSGKVRSGAVSVGLDIGSRRARVVALTVGSANEIVLQGASAVELSGAPSAEHAVSSLWGRLVGRPAAAHCNLGPASVIVQQVEFPQMTARELVAAARIEAELLIPDIQNMALDCQVIGRKKKTEDNTPVAVVMIVAAPQVAVSERAALLHRAKVRVASITPDGLAFANAVLALQPSDRGAVVALDIGAEGTSLVAVSPEENVVVPIVRFIPGGVTVLAEGSAGGEKPPSEDERELAAKRERWLREVERSIEFVSGKLDAPAQRILLVGEGSGSSTIVSWLTQNVQIPVVSWNPLKDLKRGPNAPDEQFIQQWGPDCAVAVGLALGEGD